MNGFFDRFQRFMADRNGIDRLCRFMFIVYMVFVIMNIFANSLVIYILSLLLMAFTVFRIFSRNLWKRQRENLFYIRESERVKSFLLRQRNRFRDRKTHKYVKCGNCKSHLRVKRVKGEHTVRCPRCHSTFKVKI